MDEKDFDLLQASLCPVVTDGAEQVVINYSIIHNVLLRPNDYWT